MRKLRLTGIYWKYCDENWDQQWLANIHPFRAEFDLSEGDTLSTVMIDEFGESQIEGRIGPNFISFLKTYNEKAIKRGGSELPVEYNFAHTPKGGWKGHWWIPGGDGTNGTAILAIEELRDPLAKYLDTSDYNCVDNR